MFWSFFSALLIGGLLGFVFQRSRFCLTGGFRDMYLLKNNRMFYALLIAISVQSIGVVTLVEIGYIAAPYKDFSLPATIVGSLIFGMSIILASGCATGTWYHAGEGLISAWIALIMYMVSATAMRFGVLSEFTKSIMQYGKMEESLAIILGMPIWLLVGILVTVTAILVYRTLTKPTLKVATLPPKWTGLRHYLFEKRYHPFLAAVLIGLLAFAAWGVNALSGKPSGLGITGPSANIVRYVVTGDAKLINWGVFLVLGIMLGAYIAAKGSKEFKWRMPDLATCRNSVVGGLLMGVGASLAGGCTIGNGLTATAVMSAKGWISLFFIMIGVWIMTYFIHIRPTKQAQ